MADQNINCPKCGFTIPLTEALSNQIKEGVRREFEEKARERELELKKKEDEIIKKGREIEEEKKALDETVANKLGLERAKLTEEAQRKANQSVEMELKDLRDESAQKERQISDFRRNELELRREKRELEEQKKAQELEIARKLDAERERIRRETLEIFTEEHRLKDSEKDKKIADLLRNLDDAKKRAEQGSQQAQGEVLELEIEALLKAKFPVDLIEPVPKGIRGADIIQKVFTKSGQPCGSIVWESKRTKAWSDDWIAKLKEDQREVKAEIAVLVTEALPKGVTGFTQIEGVWVTGISLACSLAEALRAGLIQEALTRLSATGKGEKMEAVYNYLSGPEFRHKIEGIVEAFKAMREDLDSEKRAIVKIWAKREKQIEKVVMNTVKMYGDMQGIIGASLPEIKSLELGTGEDGETGETGEI
ncbi:MAG: DUF2130 domain-containing protein [Deltaproteobacteria bacterium]|nr:DUF2130 domain-containing protein [Deltaproteobacteria bacterium]